VPTEPRHAEVVYARAGAGPGPTVNSDAGGVRVALGVCVDERVVVPVRLAVLVAVAEEELEPVAEPVRDADAVTKPVTEAD